MNLRPLLFIPPVALGVFGFMWMTSRPAPEVAPTPEAALAVRVQMVSPAQVSNSASGFGRVKAERSWSAISEVQGRVAEMAENLDVGTIVEQGQPLFAVDRTDYELARKKSQANIDAITSQIAELDRQETNSQTLLKVQTRVMNVAQAEFERVQALLERGAGTQAAVDTAQKVLLGQEVSVTNLNNTLALFPAQRASLQSTLAIRQAELQEVERSLEKTMIAAPFRGRISALGVEAGQFVRVGENLITLESTDAAEITAEIQPQAFGSMMFSTSAVLQGGQQGLTTGQFTQIMKTANVTASVALANGGFVADWPADIVRLRGTMDPETGAMGIVVRVADPLKLTPGTRRPPLHSGTFVKVTLSVTSQDDAIAIPRHAVHLDDMGQPYVYLSDADNRLQLRGIALGPLLGENVVVNTGLTGGEWLVLGDPRPPVVGMKLAPVDTTAGPTQSKQGN